jgi:hypothetical protein
MLRDTQDRMRIHDKTKAGGKPEKLDNKTERESILRLLYKKNHAYTSLRHLMSPRVTVQ